MFDKRAIKNLILLAFVLAIYVLTYLYNNYLPKSNIVSILPSKTNEKSIATSTNKDIYFIGEYLVNYIVDGDTIHAKDEAGKEEIIRLLVVNTPEIHNTTDRNICFGNMAKKYTEKNLLGKKVSLWGDSTQPKRDKYDRLLVYLKVSTSADFFNDSLMREGYAKVFRSTPPGTFYNKYLEYQTIAKNQKLNMWNQELCN